MKFKQNYDAMKASKKEIEFRKVINNTKKERPIVMLNNGVMWGTHK